MSSYCGWGKQDVLSVTKGVVVEEVMAVRISRVFILWLGQTGRALCNKGCGGGGGGYGCENTTCLHTVAGANRTCSL